MSVVLVTSRKQPVLTPSDDVLAGELRARGIAVATASWDELVPADLGDAVVCLRATWDYHTRSDEFRVWIGGLQHHGITVVNPAATVLWNMDKGYLGWLEARGIPVPATRWIAPGGELALPALLESNGWNRAVLKPRVSATAYGTHLVSAATKLAAAEVQALSANGALLQEYVPEIEAAGEMSLVFIDGQFTHAVRKRPAAGDFRVQHEFGGTVAAAEAGPALRDFGARVLGAVPLDWTFARVDLVSTTRGPLLMELELIEPDLFFTFGGSGAARLADALGRAASRPKG